MWSQKTNPWILNPESTQLFIKKLSWIHKIAINQNQSQFMRLCAQMELEMNVPVMFLDSFIIQGKQPNF